MSQPVGDDNKHKLTLTFTHHFYNVGPNGQIDYLSSGEQPLPTLFTLFSLAYLAGSIFWLRTVRSASLIDASTNSSPRVHHVHHLMSALSLLKTLTVFSDAMKWHYIRYSGERGKGREPCRRTLLKVPTITMQVRSERSQ